ncbi:type II secretion system F family protein [Streptomyces sp. MUM 203J]|uniref:type II secretion system F family protein n=1 Tax=Streptomyces sp. MUM 203J TaxID=2791990 RepID=UPI001F0436F2|nr:type II secretion system F family protein [Streptomyces sp. MUM 203J]MCH0541503.1 type II secretion system F family protein [Streptomyces sp. MUM 203J]
MSGESGHQVWWVVLLVVAVWAVRSLERERRVRHARTRLRGLASRGRVAERGRWRWRVPSARSARWLGPTVALVLGWALFGGFLGCVTGAAGALGVRRWQRRPRPDAARLEAERRLPLAAELLAACLSAGAGPREAAEAVGRSLGGPVGDRLTRAAAELALGGDPVETWGRFGELPGARPLARCLERAGASGAPAAGPVAGLAAGLRADRARTATARAQRAQVLITAPVGLCFLPAFLAVGVAPVVIGLATRLL